MIESSMYIGMGFLLGALVSLLFVPAVHNRAVRLTMKQLARDVPESLVEIATAKDLVRAEFAMATRQMELKFERVRAKGIDDARRLAKKDGRINQQRIEICALKVRLAGVERQLLAGNEVPLAPSENARVVAIGQTTVSAMQDSGLRLVSDTPLVRSK